MDIRQLRYLIALAREAGVPVLGESPIGHDAQNGVIAFGH